jgi:ABC-type polar amino acid transport system ATPase subunit
MLKVEHLYKSFGKHVILNDINLTVQKGEVVTIIGPSGSGKSTLLRCINCLERAEKGRIILDDIPISEEKKGITEYMKDDTLRIARLHLGMVFQNFNLFPHLTALENLILAAIYVNKKNTKGSQTLGH